MRCKSMLLGGAVILALSGAAYAQGSTGDQSNPSQPAAQSTTDQPSDTSTSGSGTSTTSHAKHHYRHHMRHSTKTASKDGPSTPAEKRQTDDLNKQQLQMAQSGGDQGQMNNNQMANGANGSTAGQSTMQPGAYTQPQQGAAPGSEPGNAAYSQPAGGSTSTGGSQAPGSPDMSAPATNAPVGAPANPATPADQNAPPSAQPGSTNPPGPSN